WEGLHPEGPRGSRVRLHASHDLRDPGRSGRLFVFSYPLPSSLWHDGLSVHAATRQFRHSCLDRACLIPGSSDNEWVCARSLGTARGPRRSHMRNLSLLIAWSFVIAQGACECDQASWTSGVAVQSAHHGGPIVLLQGPQDFPARDILAEDDLEES